MVQEHEGATETEQPPPSDQADGASDATPAEEAKADEPATE